jgi:hypothetical protein
MAQPDNLSLVALSAAEMPVAQAQLVDWCQRKVAALEQEFKELEEHHLIAQSNGWKLTSLTAALNRTKRRIDYYQKIRTAVDAGFVIVPNFPVNVLAVRVGERSQKPKRSQTAHSSWGASQFRADPQMLPAGEGRYVDDTLNALDLSRTEPDGKGGTKQITEYQSDTYDADIDFPFTEVKPVVMGAVERAMALRVFDSIGIVQNQAPGDPIFVGQIHDPRGNRRMATFFVAWWLNTEAL